jgi:hypothetical protein
LGSSHPVPEPKKLGELGSLAIAGEALDPH